MCSGQRGGLGIDVLLPWSLKLLGWWLDLAAEELDRFKTLSELGEL